jgi:large subunit ribosomal protein L37Ae
MAEDKKIGSTKRFGSRYGRKIRHRVGVIEREQRKLHKCPYCNAIQVKRIAAGIWQCRKCKVKFTGKAYSIGKKITFKEEVKEEPKEEPKKQKKTEKEDEE